jgi:hypothetical protein
MSQENNLPNELHEALALRKGDYIVARGGCVGPTKITRGKHYQLVAEPSPLYMSRSFPILHAAFALVGLFPLPDFSRNCACGDLISVDYPIIDDNGRRADVPCGSFDVASAEEGI